MTELPMLTARQAEAAVGRAGESLALTSGAGCGKTLVLARRFTELVLQAADADESPFDRFVALTFTDKAALEMVARVRAVLLDALAKSKDARDRRRLAAWITELPAAHISTIHSFCASLLRRHAVEAGVDPNFAVCADPILAAQMQAQAAEEAVLSAVDNADDAAVNLLARAELARVVGDVRALMERRIAWVDQDYSDPADVLARWRRELPLRRREALERATADPALAEEVAELRAYPCADPSDRLAAFREEKLALVEKLRRRPESVTADDLKALREKPGSLGSAKAWGGGEPLKAFRRRLARLLEPLGELACWFEPLGQADSDAADCLAALMQLARDAIARYAKAKRQAGLLDFEDLIELTARLLRQDKSIRSALRKRLSQLLIDECQDTDAHQLKMFWSLLAEGDSPPPGKLFVVGDLKQSIYRFRGAQAEVFSRLCGRFGKAQILLQRSFRTHRAGVALINSIFRRLMGRDYEPIVSSRKELPPAPAAEILLADPGPNPSAGTANAAQADLLAQRLTEMIGSERLVFDRQGQIWRPVRPGDVAILFARMTHSLEYERALRQRQVAYYVVAGTGFFRQQEVYDVLNALRAIDNPFDDVALFGTLRSALFGLDDNVLLHVADACRPPYFDKLASEAVLGRLGEPQRRQLRFARELLGDLARCKDALGPAGLIERLLTATGYAAALLSEFQGRRKLGNVHRLLETARSAQAAGGLALADFLARYGETELAEFRFEQAPVVGESDDVVRLMTIHKAKGLEFPVVIVPDLNAGRQASRQDMIFRPDWPVAYRPPRPLGQGQDEAKPTAFRLAEMAERVEEQAEDIRKLYVAVTRHQDYLILLGADWRRSDGAFQAPGGFLARLDAILGIAEALDRGQDRIELGEGFSARLARIKPAAASPGRRGRPLGKRLAAEAKGPDGLADALVGAGKPGDLPLVGPLVGPAGEAAAPAGKIAATALADFEHCPMLYRWRHELRVPVRAPSEVRGRSGVRGLDAATAGTVFHRCMELADVDRIAAADRADLTEHARALAGRVAAEMDLDAESGPIAEELAAMLDRLAGRPLLRRLRDARQRLAELSFLYRTGALDVAGQIDLLYQDADGVWHVLDYKSDRLEKEHLASHAARYELQMRLYLAAAGRHLAGETVADATLYFLRSGLEHRFPAGQVGQAGFQRRLVELGRRLTRCRRTGRYDRRGDGLCRRCPYRDLCRRGDPGSGQPAGAAGL